MLNAGKRTLSLRFSFMDLSTVLTYVTENNWM